MKRINELLETYAADSVACGIIRALGVFVYDPRQVEHLKANDPMALNQARRALGMPTLEASERQRKAAFKAHDTMRAKEQARAAILKRVDELKAQIRELIADDQHAADYHCTVDPATNLCIGCGADHSDACPDCGARAFHLEGCTFAQGVTA
jgi:hypothetical protein